MKYGAEHGGQLIDAALVDAKGTVVRNDPIRRDDRPARIARVGIICG